MILILIYNIFIIILINIIMILIILIFSKYASVVPLKNKKGISIVNAFQIILKNSSRKPNKI